MPALKDKRVERMAWLVAKGTSVREAYVQVGYKGKHNAHRIGRTTPFKRRVQEIMTEWAKETSETTIHTRKWVDNEMHRVYQRCIQAVPVLNSVGEPIGEWRCDTKIAAKLLEMMGLEQGMFKRQLDVTSRKAPMIEGGQLEILQRFAQLLRKLGLAATAQFLALLEPDNLAAAMKMNGYEIGKSNGHGVPRRLKPAKANVGSHGDGRGTDPEPLRTVSEAAPVS